MKFKTTFKCSGCVANAAPFLDNVVGKDNWEVEIQNPDKVLTIAKGKEIPAEEVIGAIQKAGYKAERIS